jgi:hypothetical protein
MSDWYLFDYAVRNVFNVLYLMSDWYIFDYTICNVLYRMPEWDILQCHRSDNIDSVYSAHDHHHAYAYHNHTYTHPTLPV